jgi:uncharacterized membrane protein YdjX (TVP38/TMEM64 family)
VKDFFWGTFIGILPGIVAIAMVADRFSKSLQQPDMTSYTALLRQLLLLLAGWPFLKIGSKRGAAGKEKTTVHNELSNCNL